MSMTEKSCGEFVKVLASKEPVPGGGGASALVGAIGTALGNMVGSLTVGKKKYAAVETDMIELKKKADRLQDELLGLVEKDAEVFEPLSEAYGMPKDTPEQIAEKDAVMAECLTAACGVPLEIMEKACEGIEIAKEFADKGSKLALSDAGVSVIMLKSALQGASLNVFINTSSMKDREEAEAAEKKADDMLSRYTVMADEVFNSVRERL